MITDLVSGPDERRPEADVLRLLGRPRLDQRPGHAQVAVPGGQVKRRAPVLVLGGHVGAVRQEQTDELGEAARRGEHERCLAGLKGEPR